MVTTESSDKGMIWGGLEFQEVHELIVKLAVHWLRVSAVIAEFNIGVYYVVGIRADSQKSIATIATHVKFGDECARA